jgi:uncharacterized membrane protein
MHVRGVVDLMREGVLVTMTLDHDPVALRHLDPPGRVAPADTEAWHR